MQDLPKTGPHYRPPWRTREPTAIYIHTSLNKLYGTHGRSAREAATYKARYDAAKTAFDMDAAVDIVNDIWNDDVVEKIVDRLVLANQPTVIVMPFPEFDAGAGEVEAGSPITNALPFAYARSLAAELGCEIDYEIIESARVGRTKLTTFERFLWQPKFSGPVKQDHAYILIDDVCTMCGTFATLRSYIVEHGGTVIAVSALAQGSGSHVQFPIAKPTVRMLLQLYGWEICDFWKQEIGHDIECLTEAEGLRLAGWFRQNVEKDRTGTHALQCLRDRFAEAKANRS